MIITKILSTLLCLNIAVLVGIMTMVASKQYEEEREKFYSPLGLSILALISLLIATVTASIWGL